MNRKVSFRQDRYLPFYLLTFPLSPRRSSVRLIELGYLPYQSDLLLHHSSSENLPLLATSNADALPSSFFAMNDGGEDLSSMVERESPLYFSSICGKDG